MNEFAFEKSKRKTELLLQESKEEIDEHSQAKEGQEAFDNETGDENSNTLKLFNCESLPKPTTFLKIVKEKECIDSKVANNSIMEPTNNRSLYSANSSSQLDPANNSSHLDLTNNSSQLDLTTKVSLDSAEPEDYAEVFDALMELSKKVDATGLIYQKFSEELRRK